MGSYDHVEADTSTETEPLKLGTEFLAQSLDHDRAGASSSDQNLQYSNVPSLKILQIELGLLRAQKLDAMNRFDEAISALERAASVLQRCAKKLP